MENWYKHGKSKQKNRDTMCFVKENMVRLIIFDLDSTLAPIGLGMGEEEFIRFGVGWPVFPLE